MWAGRIDGRKDDYILRNWRLYILSSKQKVGETNKVERYDKESVNETKRKVDLWKVEGIKETVRRDACVDECGRVTGNLQLESVALLH